MSKYELKRLGINANAINVDSPNLRLRNRAARKNSGTKNDICSVNDMFGCLLLNDLNVENNISKSGSVEKSVADHYDICRLENIVADLNKTGSSCEEAIEEDGYIQYDENDDDFSEEEISDLRQESSGIKPIILVKTQKNGRKMFHEGYFYTVETDVGDPPNNRIAWKCERTGNKTNVKCGGRAYTTNHYEPVTVTKQHNHEPEPERLACHEVIDLLKQQAVITNDNPRSLIKRAQTGLTDESSSKMRRHRNLTAMINRKRNKKADHGLNALSIAETEVPELLKVTYKDQKFYYGKYGSDNKLVFIFTTEQNLQLLQKYTDWYADGTFDVSPKLFKQLFTVNIIVKNRNLPMLYALLPDKTEISYTLVFKFIQGYISIPPKSVLVDFEKAALNAIAKTFKETSIQGCYFHLASNMWKHVNNNGLS